MQRLRNASFLARLVLAWFAFAIGAAAASPLARPVGIELVCSSAGALKLVLKSETGEPPVTHKLDCPLCTPSDAPPPPAAAADVPFEPPVSHAVRAIPAARIASLTAAPLPARGPPPSPRA